jgi:DNA-binding transcriptional ArsR family regulator
MKEKRSILLMHPVRRDIYKIVSESPGSYFFEIASTLELPHGTAAWHLKKLEDANLVDTMRFAGRRVYFSKALRNKEVEKAFVVLRSKATRQIFTYILNNDQCYQAQIAENFDQHHDTIRHHIQRLKDTGLVESVRKGRTVHYTLGPIGTSILNSNTEVISKAFVEHLMETLKEECLTPEIIEHDRGKVTLRISCPGFDDVQLEIDLKGWEFLPEIEDEDEDTDEHKISVVDDMTRRPKVTRVTD